MAGTHTRLTRHAVATAGLGELPALADLMTAAFQDDPISGWLFPDPAERVRRHPGFFAAFLHNAHTCGAVRVARSGDEARSLTGVALWLDVHPDDPDQQQHAEDGDGVEPAMSAALGPHQDRWRTLAAAMSAAQPPEPHAHLVFLAAHPAGHGAGTALLTHHLAHLDTIGRAAYLEASSPRSAALYTRHGFRPLGLTIDLPGGPSMSPMWRDPQPLPPGAAGA